MSDEKSPESSPHRARGHRSDVYIWRIHVEHCVALGLGLGPRTFAHYLMMIIGAYATLGVFLIFASRDPYAYKSIIWFTVWSSIVHAAIMAAQSFSDGTERGHLIGDVPALPPIAIVLAVLMPRNEQA